MRSLKDYTKCRGWLVNLCRSVVATIAAIWMRVIPFETSEWYVRRAQNPFFIAATDREVAHTRSSQCSRTIQFLLLFLARNSCPRFWMLSFRFEFFDRKKAAQILPRPLAFPSPVHRFWWRCKWLIKYWPLRWMTPDRASIVRNSVQFQMHDIGINEAEVRLNRNNRVWRFCFRFVRDGVAAVNLFGDETLVEGGDTCCRLCCFSWCHYHLHPRPIPLRTCLRAMLVITD